MKTFQTALMPLLLAASLFSTACLAQEKQVVLKFAHFVPQTHVLSKKAFPQWIKAVEDASGGTIKIRVFPAGQLGKPADHYDLARDGIADIAWANPGLSPGRFPIFAVSQLPMMVGDARAGSKALTEWYRSYEKKEMSDVKVCLAHMMSADMLHTKEKVVNPEDLKGMKIRPSSLAEANLIRLAGGAAVPGSNPQARDMMDRGVIDGTMSTPTSLITFGADKVATYHLAVNMSQPAWVIVINKDKYASLSPRQKKALDDNCTPDAAYRFTEPLYESESTGVKELSKHGVVTTPSAATMAKWKALAGQVKAAWAKDVTSRGDDANAIYDSFMKEVVKYNAQLDAKPGS